MLTLAPSTLGVHAGYVSKTIVKQGIEGSLGYCANGTMGVSSTMSKTRLKQGIE